MLLSEKKKNKKKKKGKVKNVTGNEVTFSTECEDHVLGAIPEMSLSVSLSSCLYVPPVYGASMFHLQYCF